MFRRASQLRAATAGATLAVLTSSPSADLLVVQGGRFAFQDRDSRQAAQTGLEYRLTGGDGLPWESTDFGAQVGYFQTDAEGSYAYGGLHLELELAPGLRLTPQTNVGHYERGEGMNLGLDLQFRSGLELSYELGANLRIGAGMYHVSNGGLGEGNPGEESLLFGIQWSPGLL